MELLAHTTGAKVVGVELLVDAAGAEEDGVELSADAAGAKAELTVDIAGTAAVGWLR